MKTMILKILDVVLRISDRRKRRIHKKSIISQALKEFPTIGNFFGVFSNRWKISERIFQPLETFLVLFPTIGKRVSVRLLLGVMFVGFSCVSWGNILTNGTFDTDTANWNLFGNCTRETWAGESGTAGMALQGWVWDGSGRFEQTMVCTTNTRYYFRIRADRQSNFATGWARMTLCYYLGDTWNTDTIYTSSTLNVSCSTGWNTYEVEGVPGSSAGKVQVKVEFSGAQNSTDPRAFMFDNAMLYDRWKTYPSNVVVEEFSYDPNYGNDMNSKDRGGNWSGAWSGSGSQFYCSDGSFGAMTGYPAPKGNKMVFTPPDNTGWSISRSFSSIKTGKVYVAYMMNYAYDGANKWCGLELLSNTTTLAFAGEISSQDKQLGLSSFGGSDVGSSFALNNGSGNDYLVIVAYDFSTRGLKTIGYYKTSTVPSVEPTTWSATATVSAGRIHQIDGIKITAGASSGTPGTCYIDEIRVAESWEQLLQVMSSNCTWTGGAGASDMRFTRDYNWDTARPADEAEISFAGSTSLYPTNDFTAGKQLDTIWFTNTSSSFTLRGNGMHVRNKIENQSSADQTNEMAITFNGDGSAEVNPVTDDITMVGDVYLETNLTLNVWGNGGHTLTFDGKIKEGNGFTTGAGVWIRQNSTVVYNDVNEYQGNTTIGDGTLRLGVNNAINNQSDVYVTNTLDLNGYDVVVNSISGNGDITLGGGDLRIAGGETKTFSGEISEAGKLIHNGGGTLTLSGANSYLGGTVVSGGVVVVSSDGNLGTVPGSAEENVTVGGWATLRFSADMTLNSKRSVTIAASGSGAHLSVDTGVAVDYGGVISGDGQFNKAGAGRLNLTGVNNHGGRTSLQNGTLAVGADRNFGAVPSSVETDWVNFENNEYNTLLVTNSFTLDSNRGAFLHVHGKIEVAADQTLTYSGIIKGNSTNSLTKDGSGTLILGGDNEFGQNVFMDAGTLIVTNPDPFDVQFFYLAPEGGSEEVAFYMRDGVTLDNYSIIRGGESGSRVMGMDEAGSATVTADVKLEASVVFSNVVSSTQTYFKIWRPDSQTYAKQGEGTFVLYSNSVADVTNEAGTIRVACDDGWYEWNHVYLQNGSVLDLDGHVMSNKSVEGAGDITLGSGGILSVANGDSKTLSGVISETGDVHKYGGSEYTLSGNNTFDGRVIIGGGTLSISADNNLSAVPAVTDPDNIIITNWAVLNAEADFDLNTKRGITLADSANGGNIRVENAVDELYYNGIVTGGGALSKAGPGTLKFGGSADHTFTGSMSIEQGTLWITLANSLDCSIINIGPFSGSADCTLMMGSSASDDLDRDINVRADTGAGIREITTPCNDGVVDFTGNITMNDDLRVSGSDGASINLAGSVDMSTSGNNDLTISGSDDVEISGVIAADTSDAALIHAGSGELYLSADNATTVDNQMMLNITGGGTVRLAEKASLGDDPSSAYADKINFSASGGALYNTVDIDLATGGDEWGITVASGVDATFNVGDGVTDDLTIPGVISGAGNVVKTGPGNLYLTGVNTFDGPVTVSAGSLRIPDDTALGDNSQTLTLNGGTLYADASMAVAAGRSVVVGASGATLGGDSTLTIDSVISGTGNLTKENANNLILTGANTFTGDITVDGGALRFSTDGNLGNTANDITLNGSTLYRVSGLPDTVTLSATRDITLGTGGGTIYVYPGKEVTIPGVVSGSTALTKIGSGTLELTGANTYSGGIDVDDGDLKGTTSGLLGNIAIANADDVVEFAQDTDGTYSGGIISGSGGLVKTGTGNVTLNGANTYSAASTVSAGTLTVHGSAANSAFTVASGATIAGDGPIGTLDLTGTVAPSDTVDSRAAFASGNVTMQAGGGFICHLGNCVNLTDRDYLNVDSGNGTVTISASSGGNEFTIYLDDTDLSNFTNSYSYSWTIVDAQTLSTFAADKFIVDSSTCWTNGNALGGGEFTVSENSGNIVLTFTPGSSEPTVINPTVTDIDSTSAILGATLQDTGGATVTETGVVWGTSSGPTVNTEAMTDADTSVPITYTNLVTGLPAGTLIYYRGYAINSQGTGYSDEDMFYTLSTEPSAQVTGFAVDDYTGTGSTRLDMSWNQVASADGYIILRSETASPTGVPSDATAYAEDEVLGNGVVAAVIQGSAVTAWTNSSLTADTHYYYKIYPFGYDGSNEGTYNYLTTGTPGSDDTYTLATNPDASPSNPQTDPAYEDAYVSWTPDSGADYSIVIMGDNSIGTDPSDRTGYTANAQLGSGSEIGTAEYVVYIGSGTNVTVTGLTPGDTYYFKIYSFNGSAAVAYNYRTGDPASDSFSTLTRPTDVVWDGGGADDNMMTGENWVGDVYPAAGNTTVLRFSGATRTTPVNNYPNDSEFGTIMFTNTTASFTIHGNRMEIADKIENYDASSHTITNDIDNIGGDALEINPFNGDLIMSGTIVNDGQDINVYGENSHLLTFSGNITGTGRLVVQQYSKVVIAASLGFGGDIVAEEGEVWFAEGGVIGLNDIYIGSASRMSETAKLWISDDDGGVDENAPITINAGNYGTRIIGGLNSSGLNEFSGDIQLNAQTLFEANKAGTTVEFSGVISGDATNHLHLNGPGTVIFSATNNFGGNVYVTNGTMELDSEDPFDGGTVYLGSTVTLNDSRLILDRGTELDVGVTVQAGSAAKKYLGMLETGGATNLADVGIQPGTGLIITNVSGSVLQIGKIFQDGGDAWCEKTGAGTLLLFTNEVIHLTNKYGTVEAGTSDGWSWTHYMGLGGTIFDLNGNVVTQACLDGAGDVTLGGGTLVINGGWNGILSGAISEAGNLLKKGSDTYTLSGVNTFDGTVTIEGGALSISADNNLGADPGTPTAASINIGNWGTLAVTDNMTLDSDRGITVHTGGGGVISNAAGKTLVYDGIIAGASQSFTFKGVGGTIQLGGATTYDVNTYIDSGILDVRNADPFNSDIYLGMESGSEDATLTLGAAGVSIDKPLIVRAGSSGTKTVVAGNGSGTVQFSAGYINLYDNVTFTVNSGGTLSVAVDVNMSVSGSQDMTINGANDMTVSAGIIATDSNCDLNYNGSGTLTLSGDNRTSVENQMKLNIGGGGTVVVSSINQLGDDPGSAYTDKINFHTSGGTLQASGDVSMESGTYDWGITIADTVTATLLVDDTRTMTIPGVISGSGNLSKTGAGTLALSGSSTYTGSSTLSAGTLIVNGDVDASSGLTMGAATTLEGTGSIPAATLSGTVKPGNGTANNIGTLTAEAVTLPAGGTLEIDFGDVDSTWDQIDASAGTITVTASSGTEFTIKLYDDNISGWDESQDYTWVIISGGTLSGFNATDFTLDTTGWSSPAAGEFSVIQSDNNIAVHYAGTEPDDPQAFSVDAVWSDTVTMTFTPNVAADNVVIARNTSGTFSAPSGVPPAVGQAFAGGTLVYNGTSSPQDDTGLTANTRYYYKAFSYGNSYYSDGLTDDDTTYPDAPEAAAASSVSAYQFDANWSAPATGADSYLLDVYDGEWEDFTNSSLTGWSGDTASFSVLTDTTTPSGGATTDRSFLGSDQAAEDVSLMIASAETNLWMFSLASGDFAPSGVNYFGVVLMASSAFSGDIDAANFTGYYLRIGDSGDDKIALYRSTGLGKESVGTFSGSPSFSASGMNEGVNLIVRRDARGVFSLYYSTNFLMDYASFTYAGQLTNDAYDSSSYFGVYQHFGSTDAGYRTYLDHLVLATNAVVSGYASRAEAGISATVTNLLPDHRYFYAARSVTTYGISTNSNIQLQESGMPQCRNTAGGTPGAPAHIYLGDTNLEFSAETWGTLSRITDTNWGRARLWIDTDSDVSDGKAGAWTGYLNVDGKTNTSQQFTSTGTWYWGVQMDYSFPFGTNFWYTFDSSAWVSMSPAGTSSLSVTVNELEPPTGVTATGGPSPYADIYLEWTKWSDGGNTTAKDVLIVRSDDASFTAPDNGTTYAKDDTIGGDLVIYKGGGTTCTDTGLTVATTYYYALYSENYTYYSAASNLSAQTGSESLTAPSDCYVIPDGPETMRAYWTRDTSAGRVTLVVRRQGGAPTPPSNGTTYTNLEDYGTGTKVIYKGTEETSTDLELFADTSYTYAFYTCSTASDQYSDAGTVRAGGYSLTGTTYSFYMRGGPIDSFAYWYGGVVSQNGGTNWNGAWGHLNGFCEFTNDSLSTIPNYPPVRGGKIMMTPATPGDSVIQRSIDPVGTGVLYIAYIFKHTTAETDKYLGIGLFEGVQQRMYFGVSGYETVLGCQYTNSAGTFITSNSSFNVNAGDDYTVVAKLDFDNHTAGIKGYYSGALPGYEPIWDAETTFPVDHIGAIEKMQIKCGNLDGGDLGDVYYDELRFSTNWQGLVESTNMPVWTGEASPLRGFGNNANWYPPYAPETNMSLIFADMTAEVRGNVTNDYDDYTPFRQVWFTENDYNVTVRGAAVKVTEKMENASTNSHEVETMMSFCGVGGGYAEINPALGNITVDGLVYIDSNIEVRVWGDNRKTLTFEHSIGEGIDSGNGKFAVKGDSIVVFDATNAYAGATTVENGDLVITEDKCLGTQPSGLQAAQLVLNEQGTLVMDISSPQSLHVNRGITLGVNGGQIDVADSSLAIAGPITGSGSLTKLGSGTLILTNHNSDYTGKTYVSNGVIQIITNGCLGAAPGTPTDGQLTLYNAMFDLTPGAGSVDLNVNRNYELKGTGVVFEIAASETLRASGAIKGSADLLKTGAGSMWMTNQNNAHTGEYYIQAGRLAFGDNTFGSGDVHIQDGANWYLDIGSETFDAAHRVYLSGTAYIECGSGSDLTENGIIDGSGSLNKQGDGGLFLYNDNLYSGGTVINGGTVFIDADESLGAAAGNVTIKNWTYLKALNSLTLDASRNVILGTDGDDGGQLVADVGTVFSVPGTVSGDGMLKFTGGGELQLLGANTYTGRTILGSGGAVGTGMLTLGADNNLGAVPGSVESSALQFETTDWQKLNITNSFTLHQNRGIWLFNVNANIEVAAGKELTYNGIINGPGNYGSVSKGGDGWLTLGGQNAFTNLLNVNRGYLKLTEGTDPLDVAWINLGEDTNTSPDSPEVYLVLADGVEIDNQIHSRTNSLDATTGDRYIMMQETGAAELKQGIRISDTLAISNVAGSTLTFSGAIWQNNKTADIGDQSIRKLGSGTAELNDAGNAVKYFDVEEGTMRSTVHDALCEWTDLNVSEGATYDLNDYNLTVQIALGDGTIDTGPGAGNSLFVYKGYNVTSLVYVTGNGGFTKTGAAGEFWDFALRGTNDYTGPTKVEHGTLRVYETTNIGSGSIIIETSSTLRCEADMTFDSSRTFTMTDHGQIAVITGNTVNVDGVIGGNSMSLYGGGTLRLNAANTFNGSLFVNEGTLSLNAADPLACSTLQFGPESAAWNVTLDIGDGVDVGVPMVIKQNSAGDYLHLIRNTGTWDSVYSGTITVEPNDYQLDFENSGVGGSLTINNINNNANKTFLYIGANTVTFAGNIYNDNGIGIDKRGGGTMLLTGSSDLTGSLYIVGGTVAISNSSGNALAASPAIFLGEDNGLNCTLAVAGGSDVTNRVESRNSANVINTVSKYSVGSSEFSGELTIAYGLTENNSFRIDNSAGGEMLFSGAWNLAGDQRGVQITGDIKVTGAITNGTGSTYNGLVKRGEGTMEIDGMLGVNFFQDQGNVVIGSNCTFVGVDTYYLGTRDNEDYDQDDTFLTFQDAQTFTNGITVGTLGVDTGTRQINFENTNGTVEISGAIVLGTNANRYLVLSNQTANVELSGDITGDGGLIKQGAGTVRFSANATYEDLTRVEEGTLLLNSITNTASMVISNGAVLAGQGRVGAITNAGALGPALDGAPGTLKCSSLEFEDGAQFNCAITSTGNDLLGVLGSGDVTFGGTVILNITNLGGGSLFQNMIILDYRDSSGSSVGSPTWVITGDVTTAMADYITVTNDLGDYWYIKGANPECNITNGAPAVGDDLEVSLEVDAVEGMDYDLIYVDAINYSDSLSNSWKYLYTETATSSKITFTNNLSNLSVGYLRFLRVSPLSAWSNNVGKYASRQIYVGKRVRLYPGRNWVAPPSYPASPTVSNVFGYNLPAGNIDSGTMVYLYNQGSSITATGSMLLASGTPNHWEWQTGGSGSADQFAMPIDQGFMVDMPGSSIRQFALIGALRTNTQNTVIAGGQALTFVSILLPANMHPDDLGLLDCGFKGSYRLSKSDQLYIWDRVNQCIKYNSYMWYNTTSGRWEWADWSAVTGTPISQDDAILLYTQGSGYTWTNSIYYTPPTSTMNP